MRTVVMLVVFVAVEARKHLAIVGLLVTRRTVVPIIIVLAGENRK
jgi:hypothetical protein